MSERDALVEKFKKMAAKEGLTLSDQEAAEYAAEWNAMQGGSTPAATRAAPPPAAKPPPKSRDGLVEKGNIDLTNRPHVKNRDKYSSVLSKSWNIDGVEVLLPTISDDGRIMSDEETKAQYFRTGKHLGKFTNPESATVYADQLHKEQERMGRTTSRPTNAAQKGDAATPPKGGPKGTVTQKAAVVAREPAPAVSASSAEPPRAVTTLRVPEVRRPAPFASAPRVPTPRDVAQFIERWDDDQDQDPHPPAPRRLSEVAHAKEVGARSREFLRENLVRPVRDIMDFHPSAQPASARELDRNRIAASAGFQPSPASARELDRNRERLADLNIPNAHSMSDARVAALMATPAVQKALAE